MPKEKKLSKLKSHRQNPLHVDLLNDIDPTKGVRKPKVDSCDSDNDADSLVIGAAMSAKILQLAAEQQNESVNQDGDQECLESGKSASLPTVDSDGFVNIDSQFIEADEIEFDKYVHKVKRNGIDGLQEQRTLADLIMAKIQEQDQNNLKGGRDKVASVDNGLDPKVIEVYTEISTFLAKYKSGKLPKAFKIIPRLTNWEEILYLTGPVNWTPNAMHEATKIFASNLNPRMAQRFYNLVLLPAVRDDIIQNKKLNFHYYEALRKALYKPAAWFKGLLFPLLLDGCNLKEAVIFGSVLSKETIPPVHIAAPLIRLCQLHHNDPLLWSAPTSYIIGILLNKKSALPMSAIDAAVSHFKTFIGDSRSLPVVWHRSLLTLVQRYKFDLSAQNKSDIRDVLKCHCHYSIGPEIRRELQLAESMKWTSSEQNSTSMELS